MFDCGSGVCAHCNATGVKWSDRLRDRVGRPADALLGDRIAWSGDLMVFRVCEDRIAQCRAKVDDDAIVTHTVPTAAKDAAPPKYYLLQDGEKVARRSIFSLPRGGSRGGSR